jgi:ubiquinone/menaquinone biosynthesis C-methylase UbiE/uncharacterized membrane protein YbhN (UPF0104 family)
MAWVVLLASASAVLLTGLVGTALILGNLTPSLGGLTASFWVRLAVATMLTVASLGVRSLRWIFLLRRAETRIPIRDAYIGYFAGLSLLLVPFLLGEIAVRAWVLRARGRVPVATTIIVNLWDRALDMTALALVAGVASAALGSTTTLTAGLVLLGLLTLLKPLRRLGLSAAAAVARPAARWFDEGRETPLHRLSQTRAWLPALCASLLAWLLPGAGLWLLAGAWTPGFGLVEAQRAYALSSALGGLVLAPGGILVAGTSLLDSLRAAGFTAEAAALVVVAIRLATVGVATMLGAVFVLLHVRSAPAIDGSHFDAIADAYDVQIPASRREALLDRKTAMMRDAIRMLGVGPRGLDVGCGQGSYVARMRELGFDAGGIDASPGQIALAARHLKGAAGVVRIGSVLEIPSADASYDFVYIINVLHHLPTVDDQRRAFAELFRVLRPGGALFVHEINTRNALFRFYMGYVFPSLNCIDEGVERWLLPHRLQTYTDAPVVDVRYFTFLPDFVPRPVVRLLTPLERLLERSPLRVFSAHYMAVLQKPSESREAVRAGGGRP